MDITFPLLILCIPLFMFLLLGIAGCKMSHKMAGILGTAGMGVTAVMAYTVKNLEPSTVYFFRVTAVSGSITDWQNSGAPSSRTIH